MPTSLIGKNKAQKKLYFLVFPDRDPDFMVKQFSANLEKSTCLHLNSQQISRLSWAKKTKNNPDITVSTPRYFVFFAYDLKMVLNITGHQCSILVVLFMYLCVYISVCICVYSVHIICCKNYICILNCIKN